LGNIEILIIDDGSTDESPVIIREYGERDRRIRVISKPNGGLASARNSGIEAARGEYILHVDSDDWIEGDMCETLYGEAKRHGAGMVSSHVYFEFPKGARIKPEPYPYVCAGGAVLKYFTFRRGINSVCNKLILRRLYIDNNIRHYEDISLGEDSSALLRLFLFLNKLVCVDKAFYHYDLRTPGMTRGVKKDVFQYLKALVKVEQYYKDNNADTSLFPFIRLKVCYGELVNCSFGGALKNGLTSYIELYAAFYREAAAIIFNKLFLSLPLAYRLFVLYKFFLRF
jgi:glycosyltransferase involved in cell wall biosynthesis